MRRSCNVESCKLKVGSKEHSVPSIKYNQKSETVIFKFNQQIPKGKFELEIKFKGILNDLMRGFYRSKYFHEGKEKYMATTQFEATDARRAFPCVDEPAAKAVFDVTLMIPNHTTAISNTIETGNYRKGRWLQRSKIPANAKNVYVFVGFYNWRI